jgi:hypothetical protein
MHESAPLYAAPWWLDSTCGQGGWETYILKDVDKNSLVFIPYHKTTIRGMSAIINPPMSQWLPVLKSSPELKISLDDFFYSLPAFSILDIALRQDDRMDLPDARFRVNHKYSYLIESVHSPEIIKSKYNEGLRRNLREAERNYQIEETGDMNTFLLLCHASYEQRKIKLPVWIKTISTNVYEALKKHQSGIIEFAYYKGKPIAGIMTGWDKETSYYLLGGRTGDEAGASAHALLLDHAIMKAMNAGRSFDFEGSMHPGIANFFQSFGATPEPHWRIKKFKGPGKLWSILHN